VPHRRPQRRDTGCWAGCEADRAADSGPDAGADDGTGPKCFPATGPDGASQRVATIAAAVQTAPAGSRVRVVQLAAASLRAGCAASLPPAAFPVREAAEVACAAARQASRTDAALDRQQREPRPGGLEPWRRVRVSLPGAIPAPRTPWRGRSRVADARRSPTMRALGAVTRMEWQGLRPPASGASAPAGPWRQPGCAQRQYAHGHRPGSRAPPGCSGGAPPPRACLRAR
jgi:hypothetical protein